MFPFPVTAEWCLPASFADTANKLMLWPRSYTLRQLTTQKRRPNVCPRKIDTKHMQKYRYVTQYNQMIRNVERRF